MKGKLQSVDQMKDLKKNELISIIFTLHHDDAESLSSSLKTEVKHNFSEASLSLEISSDNFSELRGKWNSIMRVLIASEQTLTSSGIGGEQ